jgi:membrane fusion protein (multidrug efflux system)
MKYLLVAIAIGISGCGHEPKPIVPPGIPVSTTKAISKELPVYIILPGTTKSIHIVLIQARVEGWLEERHFEEGKMVQEGDLLYEIDATQYKAQLLQAEASLTSAEAQALFTKKELERNEPLFHSGAISQQSFDRLITESEQADSQVLASIADVELARLNLGYCSIYSPITGRIGKTNVNVGTLVGPTTNNKLAEVVQVNPMYVEFYPQANRLSMIQSSLNKGEMIPIQLIITEDKSEGQPSISTSTIITKTITGSLVFVDNEIQSSTSTFLARGEFDNSIGVLPGQYASVHVQLQVIKNAIMIPVKSVMQQPGSYYVWTISDKNTAVITPVTLGLLEGGFQHVLSGLNDGDEVIVEGTASLRSGAPVSVTTNLGKTK